MLGYTAPAQEMGGQGKDADLFGAIGELRSIAGMLRDRELIRTVEGEVVIAACLRSVCAEAREDLASLCAALPALTRQTGTEAVQTSQVSRREMYPRALLASDAHEIWVRDAAVTGRQVRTLPAVPAGLTVVDDQAAVVELPIERCDGAERAVHIRDAGLVRLVRELYESMWRRASPVSPFAAMPGNVLPVLTTRQQLIGTMLADGMKDESIARRLGLSLRTVRKEVSGLLAALAATSRFQAGVSFARALEPTRGMPTPR